MPKIIPSYTMCSITAHIKKDFQLQLARRPNDNELGRLKNELNLNEAIVDSDDDVVCTGGASPHRPGVVIKNIQLYLSKQAFQVVCLRGTTDDCFDILFHCLKTLYSVDVASIESGIDYINHSTTTKVEFPGPIYGMFSESMQKQIANWTDLNTHQLVNPVGSSGWQKSAKGVIDIAPDGHARIFGGQSSAIVIPARVQFSIWVPTKFSKMTSYMVAVESESVEDFYENKYSVKSDFPYETHREILEYLETMKC